MKKTTLIIIRTTTEDYETYCRDHDGEVRKRLIPKGSPSSAYIVKGYISKLFFFGQLVKTIVSPEGKKKFEVHLIKVPLRNCSVYSDVITLEFPETYDYDSVNSIILLDDVAPEIHEEIIENLNFIYN